MSDEELQAIREREAKATKGPWHVHRPRLNCYIKAGRHFVMESRPYGVNRLEDASFIAHAREDVPALLAFVGELQAIIRGMADRIVAQSDLLTRRAEK